MLTPAWKPLRYHPMQSALWRTDKRFAAVCAGRRSGKSELMQRYIVRCLPIVTEYSDANYAYILPTREQAKRNVWDRVKALIPKHWLKTGKELGSISESELTIKTKFGSTFHLIGADRPARLDGIGLNGVVIDESSDQKDGLFALNVVPAITDRNGWCRRIGIPKRFGVGAVEFQKYCTTAEKGNDPDCGYFYWHSADIVDAKALAYARSILDPKDYNEQFAASWETSTGNIFYQFSDVHNVRDSLTYKPNEALVIGSDFNVSPMSWVIGHRYANELHIIDELFIKDTSTQQTLDILYKKYGSHAAGFEFFGDATSKARKTAGSAAAQSDYLIIKADTRFKNARTFYTNANPAVVNRFAACNALFANADNVRRCFIHPRCKQLIADLKRRAWKKDTREPDDSGEIGHMSDALGYVIHRCFPIRSDATTAAPQIGLV